MTIERIAFRAFSVGSGNLGNSNCRMSSANGKATTIRAIFKNVQKQEKKTKKVSIKKINIIIQKNAKPVGVTCSPSTSSSRCGKRATNRGGAFERGVNDAIAIFFKDYQKYVNFSLFFKKKKDHKKYKPPFVQQELKMLLFHLEQSFRLDITNLHDANIFIFFKKNI